MAELRELYNRFSSTPVHYTISAGPEREFRQAEQLYPDRGRIRLFCSVLWLVSYPLMLAVQPGGQ